MALQFTFPEHTNHVRALGYACGLSTGIASPTYPHLPPQAPIYAKGPLSTNNPDRFREVFAEGHDLGFQFGSQAAQELAKVLVSVPEECWWPVTMYFAAERIMQEDMPAGTDEPTQQGVEAFRCIYQQHLL